MRHFSIFLLFGIERRVLQQFRKTEQAAKRRAQLMTDHRQKLRFGLAGIFCTQPQPIHLLQILFTAPEQPDKKPRKNGRNRQPHEGDCDDGPLQYPPLRQKDRFGYRQRQQSGIALQLARTDDATVLLVLIRESRAVVKNHAGTGRIVLQNPRHGAAAEAFTQQAVIARPSRKQHQIISIHRDGAACGQLHALEKISKKTDAQTDHHHPDKLTTVAGQFVTDIKSPGPVSPVGDGCTDRVLARPGAIPSRTIPTSTIHTHCIDKIITIRQIDFGRRVAAGGIDDFAVVGNHRHHIHMRQRGHAVFQGLVQRASGHPLAQSLGITNALHEHHLRHAVEQQK